MINDKELSAQFATTTNNLGGIDATPRTSNVSGFSSRQSHQSVLDGMTEGYAVLDGTFRIVDINREAMRLDDRPRETLIGRTHWEAYPGSKTSELGQLYQKAMRERTPVALEHRYKWGDGRASWLAMRAYPTDDGGLAIFFRDVSERHAQDQRLIESEARFRAAIDATQDILWINDAAGKMVGSQPGWAQLTGQTQEEYQGYGWSNAVHPDDAQPTIVAWEAAVTEKRPFVFEHRVRRHDGVWRRCAIRAVPIVDTENNIREWVGVHTDITESRATQTRFRQLAETITEVFYVLEVAAGRISYVSPAYERVWRRSTDALYNDHMTYLAAIHPDDHHQAEKALERQQKGLNSDVRYRLLHDDGTVTYIHDRAFVTSDPDTGAPRVVGLAEDVTTSTKARQLQDVLMREIEHRVRNSLSIVGGLLSMQERTASNDETAVALRSASSRVVAIARIHERLYKAKNLESVEFGAYLAALCDDLARTAAHDGLTFDVQTEAINIPVDQAVPLALVANELITDACKYAGRQGPAKIVARLTADDAELTLEVSDTGPGVPPSFDAKASIGLGMQVVRALVQQVRGMVEMSRPGALATFVIHVPITRA